MAQKEIWKDVPGFEGYYQASNMGRVRSLDRTVIYKDGQERFYKGTISNWSINKGYKQTGLSKNGKGRTFKISQIIAMTFLNHKPKGNTMVVDHINGDRLDDRVENLRIVSNRANSTICFRSDRDLLSSIYAGVYRCLDITKWESQIYHDGVSFFLGRFDNEIEASNAYQSALSKIKDKEFNPKEYKSKFSSNYKGVFFHNGKRRWMARITVNQKRKHLGSFQTELEAHKAYQDALTNDHNE